MFDCYNPSMQRIPHTAELADRRDAPRIEVDGATACVSIRATAVRPINCALLDYSVTGVRLRTAGEHARCRPRFMS